MLKRWWITPNLHFLCTSGAIMGAKRAVIKLNAKGALAAVGALKPEAKRYEVRTDQRGLLIVVMPTGVRSYVVQWGRGKRKLIGHHR